MSDFEQWLETEKLPKPYWGITGSFTPEQLKTFALKAYQAAIASMQGEAEIVKWWNGCDKSVPAALRFLAEYTPVTGGCERHNWEHIHQLAEEIEKMAGKTLFTYPPSAAAEIARLTKELEEARKQLRYCLDDYAYIPTQILECTKGLTDWIRERSKVIDAAIRQIGGGE